MADLTDDIKQVYNAYLKAIAKKQNRGFRYRTNFDSFEDDKFAYCNRIARLFNQYPHIDMETYFEAPIKLNDDFYPTLKYYTTHAAMKSYTLWLKQRQNLPPDHEYHIQAIKRSLKFITRYCTDNNIEWDEYINSDNLVPHWVQQLKDNSISIYTLMGFTDFRQKLDSVEGDIKALYIQNISDNYITYKRAYMQSEHAKPLVDRGFIACKKFVKSSSTH